MNIHTTMEVVNNMIDIHSHIIPAIDDGSHSFEETYQMLKEAEQAGFTDVIATSHYIENYYETDTQQRQKSVDEINNKLKENNINIKVHCGSEIYVSQNMVDFIKNKKASSLANTKYVLFELPMNNNIMYLDDIIFEIQSAGFIPIIAHPERYSYVQDNPKMLVELINKGVLFQANFGSIIGKYGNTAKKTLKKLLQYNMIHFFGADAHRSNSIYTNIDTAITELRKIISEEKLIKLTLTNSEHLLKNEDIDVETVMIKNNIFSGLFKK